MAKGDKSQEGITRKEFLQGALAGAVLLGAGGTLPALGAPLFRADKKSIVAIARDPSAVTSNGDYVAAKVQQLVDRSIAKALQTGDVHSALKKIIKPSDVVGLKVNCIAGYSLCSRPEVAFAIAKRLQEIGVPADHIIIWDRTDAELINCRYRINKAPGAVQVYGTSPSVGYTAQPIKGGTRSDKLSKILTDKITKLINVPVLKTHSGAGVTLALKNHLGSNANPGSYHPDDCKTVGDLNASAPIKSKTVLVVSDALRPLYKGGPGDNPSYRWTYGGVLASTDPVAHDRVAYEILHSAFKSAHGAAAWGHEKGLKHINRAGELGLGHSNLRMIQQVNA